jgi:hypothetical protein
MQKDHPMVFKPPLSPALQAKLAAVAAFDVACQYLTFNPKEELHGKRDA